MAVFQLLITSIVGLLGCAKASSHSPTWRTFGITSNLVATEFGSVFDAPVVIGNQMFRLLVDTGSSDTYVMQSGYTCVSKATDMVIPREDCLYSNKTYDISESYRSIPHEMFGVKYGAGVASGFMASEDVQLGGIYAKGQRIGIANVSNPMGDRVNSGLLGLSYPSITSAHPANHTSNATYWFDRLVYSPLLYTMQRQGSIDPYFSLALEHTPQNASTAFGGYLTLSGLPPVNHSTQFSTVPVETTEAIPLSFTSGRKVRSYWTTTISDVTFGSTSNNLAVNSTSFQAFFDSGNPLSYLPSAVVEPINALFDPPAVYDPKSKVWMVDCSAKAPQFGLTIGNQTFFHKGQDLIYQTSKGVCMSSLATSESISIDGLTLNIVGVPFLKNVVAVFDFGQNVMRFAKKLDFNESMPGIGGGNGMSIPKSSGSNLLQEIGFGHLLVLFMVAVLVLLGL
ncbi:hypothetical protein N7474_001334 [Penicillium riverlandense]|uniref:uncharacterized protein n=1 Tax=Penicillium riverlandense TaxID=1903569 RepID=UPI0025496CDD|nr:uncharacterized protein N7474_001334 [Penicillium riverlandense]KAJ5833023.1 hypothetical protein N7474_001334 [Penicillium riverlandense]